MCPKRQVAKQYHSPRKQKELELIFASKDLPPFFPFYFVPCVTLGKSYDLSVPQNPNVCMKDDTRS